MSIFVQPKINGLSHLKERLVSNVKKEDRYEQSGLFGKMGADLRESFVLSGSRNEIGSLFHSVEKGEANKVKKHFTQETNEFDKVQEYLNSPKALSNEKLKEIKKLLQKYINFMLCPCEKTPGQIKKETTKLFLNLLKIIQDEKIKNKAKTLLKEIIQCGANIVNILGMTTKEKLNNIYAYVIACESFNNLIFSSLKIESSPLDSKEHESKEDPLKLFQQLTLSALASAGLLLSYKKRSVYQKVLIWTKRILQPLAYTINIVTTLSLKYILAGYIEAFAALPAFAALKFFASWPPAIILVIGFSIVSFLLNLALTQLEKKILKLSMTDISNSSEEYVNDVLKSGLGIYTPSSLDVIKESSNYFDYLGETLTNIRDEVNVKAKKRLGSLEELAFPSLDFNKFEELNNAVKFFLPANPDKKASSCWSKLSTLFGSKKKSGAAVDEKASAGISVPTHNEEIPYWYPEFEKLNNEKLSEKQKYIIQYFEKLLDFNESNRGNINILMGELLYHAHELVNGSNDLLDEKRLIGILANIATKLSKSLTILEEKATSPESYHLFSTLFPKVSEYLAIQIFSFALIVVKNNRPNKKVYYFNKFEQNVYLGRAIATHALEKLEIADYIFHIPGTENVGEYALRSGIDKISGLPGIFIGDLYRFGVYLLSLRKDEQTIKFFNPHIMKRMFDYLKIKKEKIRKTIKFAKDMTKDIALLNKIQEEHKKAGDMFLAFQVQSDDKIDCQFIPSLTEKPEGYLIYPPTEIDIEILTAKEKEINETIVKIADKNYKEKIANTNEKEKEIDKKIVKMVVNNKLKESKKELSTQQTLTHRT